MLILSEADRIIEKWGYKWGMIYPGGTENYVIVFILLIKMVAFYIELTLIGFWDHIL